MAPPEPRRGSRSRAYIGRDHARGRHYLPRAQSLRRSEEALYDLTDIHAVHDRSRHLAPETIALWLDAIAEDLPGPSPRLVIDAGCGTGRFTGAARAHRVIRQVTAASHVEHAERVAPRGPG